MLSKTYISVPYRVAGGDVVILRGKYNISGAAFGLIGALLVPPKYEIEISNEMGCTSVYSTFSSNNPRFEDVDNNLYQLDSTSIAIDYGSASFLSADPILNTDITGQFRPLGFNPDLGAYERR